MLSKDIFIAVRVYVAVKLFLGDSNLSDKVGRDNLLKNSLGGGLVTGERVTLGTMDQMEVAGVLPVDELFFTHNCFAVIVCKCVFVCWLIGKKVCCFVCPPCFVARRFERVREVGYERKEKVVLKFFELLSDVGV